LNSMGHEVINLRHLSSLSLTHGVRKGLDPSTFEAKAFPTRTNPNCRAPRQKGDTRTFT
jgi:hypothetical protein